jgi:biopolymer transport protein ExbB
MLLKTIVVSLVLLMLPQVSLAGSPDRNFAAVPTAGEADDPAQQPPAAETTLAGEQPVMMSPWWQSALDLLDTGGPVVALLLIMSVIALTIVLVKLAQFHRARLWQRASSHRALSLWQQGRVDDALRTADASANPTAQALARAIRGRRRQLPEAQVREELLRYGSDALFQLRRGLRPLEVIGSVSPLLGLLGTVLGMIEAFQQLEAAGNKVNPAILSGGIWEALLTTAVGLCVAIPVVVVLNWLERRVDHLAHEMDNLVTQVFTEDLSAAADPQVAPGAASATLGDPAARRTAHAGA